MNNNLRIFIVFLLFALAPFFISAVLPAQAEDANSARAFGDDDDGMVDEAADDALDEAVYDETENYIADEAADGALDESDDSADEEDNLDSLFENLEDDNLMYVDTSFAWDNKTINSGRFDYRTLGPNDIIYIPLIDSSHNKLYAHPIINQVTSHFGSRRNAWHYGTDVRLKTGDPVKSALDGIVRVIQFDRRGYGNVVVVRHHNGLETLYGHLSKVLVKPNQTIKAGESVGLGGNTGRSTGAHLHFEIRYYGEPFNPEYIVDFDNSVLKSDTLVLTRNNFEYLTEIRKTVYYAVRNGDTLRSIAKRYGTNVNKLCRMNGITTKTVLRVGRKLVVRSGTDTERQIVSENTAQASANTRSTQTAVAPKAKNAPEVREVQEARQTPEDLADSLDSEDSSDSSDLADEYYTVQKGDTLDGIARRHGTTINNLCRLNNITPRTVLRVGRKLVIGMEADARQRDMSDNTARTSAKARNTQSAAAKKASADSSDIYHIVRSGETLSGIAKHYRTTVNSLCRLNNITPQTILSVGRRLVVRNGTEAKR